ncbi:Phosphoglucomutase/phosphomannomutase [Spathaspora passalidarum NRRL Y-27907]|uniref:Phosphoglucomutase/phosphomannomutase n=1 Tax=Spathaspora passalidarum (strain NRRL Y-27907 / 11-Y1) TaxID=619300 RepID=G3ARY8_SPAPN|nr:Phosphoglucomutase/phosphomannomutase [Spathaspora passalidarum NRRL Y-27907]EGW31837.1 Phosphoglucomutase/phosphomannomutase [Spathaspora passalidarum NRRL Y-27907]
MNITNEHKQQLDTLVESWISIDINPQSKQEILELQSQQNYDVLSKKLSHRIAFGTAGLRSSMESGFAHMNDVTVLQASQGLIEYLISVYKEETSIVVGYDHRYNSQRFAEILTSVAVSKGVKVYYLGSVENLSKQTLELSETSYDNNDLASVGYVHTPLVPFAIDFLKAKGGVMITASHNPARDNGYKVYFSNGCQIIPPQDQHIAESIERNLQPWEGVWDVAGKILSGKKQNLIEPVRELITKEYLEGIKSKLITNDKLSFNFVYTPMHGVGLDIFQQCIDLFAHRGKYEVVKQQAKPDPEFPTVKFPNPEEKGALDLSISHAKNLGYKLVVANDPDADRFTVAIETKTGVWKQLTGNEIGFLFAVYFIEEVVPKESLKDVYLVNSTVSSQILDAMAENQGFHFAETLTGFKWIGNKAIDLEKSGYKVPFGYEEAIGFMFNLVHDKDGVSAAVIWLQLYEKWFADGKLDPVEKLEQGYSKYGWFKEYNGYYRFQDGALLNQIFELIRKSYTGHYPETIGSFKVVSWRDLTIGYDSTSKDNIPLLPIDPTSQMITAVLKRGSGDESVRFTCRGSGTEPKLKLYIEGKSKTSETIAREIAKECWETLREEWFKPEKYELEEVHP